MSVIYSGQAIYRPARWSLGKTAPAQEPVGLEEMKAWARVDDADSDATIAGNIVAARRWVETFTQRALITRTFTYKIDRFPGPITTVIELLGGNTQTLTSIAYLDSDGNSQTWTASDYIADKTSEPALVGLAYNIDWPIIRIWDLPVTITYDAGYGDNPGDVPEELRTAIKIIAAEHYENREDSIVGTTVTGVSWGAQRLCEPYRIHRII